MERIYNWRGNVIDLGNIKYIHKWSEGNGYWSVTVELLRGNEYVRNEENGKTELIIPTISVLTTKPDDFIKDISEAWEEYLEDKDKNSTNGSS